MKKSTLITSVYIIITSLLLIFSLALVVFSIYDYINEVNPIYILCCIGFVATTFLLIHLLYVFVKGKDFFLFRLRLKLTIMICNSKKLDDEKKRFILENFLNSREKIIRKICPVCGKKYFTYTDRPCPRCKTKFDKDETEFKLERASVTSHRLEALYETDFRKLATLIVKYEPLTNISPTSGDDTNINININIR